MGILGCSQPQSPANTAEILHRGLSGEPATLDPAAAADTFSSEVMEDLYEGLTTESPSGEIIPGVASSWTVDASGTQYTFQLRPDAQWSNGNPVRAQDFIAAWQRALDPKQGSPVADDLRLILNAPAIIAGKSPVSALGVEARGDSVLIVNLEQPAPYFPQMLSHSCRLPDLLGRERAQSRSRHLGVRWGLRARGMDTEYGGRARARIPTTGTARRCVYRASNMW